ncbi:MAG: hypothetical protein AAB647_01575 [Patescibacteria group bacterium]
MAQTKDTVDVHYRLFAILVMFITLLLGMGIGFLGGYDVGQQNAFELLQKGRTAEATTVQEKAEKSENNMAALAKCYTDNLGAERYAKWTAGEGLTVEEVFAVLPCESLKTTTK